MTFEEWFDAKWNGTGKESHELRFRMRAAWDAATKAERERCATICESEPERQREDGVWARDQQACADAIRATQAK